MNPRTLAAACGCALLTACLTPPAARQPDTLRTPFSQSEHQPFAASGAGSLKGQAFLRQRGGGVVTCAGSEVALLPHTEYFLELTWHIKERRPVQHEATALANLPSIVRRTHCDAQGFFTFTQLPAGQYIVITDVSWEVLNRRQGGAVMQIVEVAGAQATVLMSDTRPLR